MRLLVTLLLNGLVIYACSEIFSGIEVRDFWAALVAAFILGLVNFFIRPIITLLTLPITILTLGLFLLVINGSMVLLADAMLDGFEVRGLGWAIILSLLLAAANLMNSDREKARD